MKKDKRTTIEANGKTNWRRLGVMTAVLCALSAPVWAQNPASDDATLNFVGADIESVIKAIRAVKGDDVSLKLQNEFYEKSTHPLDTQP